MFHQISIYLHEWRVILDRERKKTLASCQNCQVRLYYWLLIETKIFPWRKSPSYVHQVKHELLNWVAHAENHLLTQKLLHFSLGKPLVILLNIKLVKHDLLNWVSFLYIYCIDDPNASTFFPFPHVFSIYFAYCPLPYTHTLKYAPPSLYTCRIANATEPFWYGHREYKPMSVVNGSM